MITMYRVMSGKDRVDSNLWFDMANQREVAHVLKVRNIGSS